MQNSFKKEKKNGKGGKEKVEKHLSCKGLMEGIQRVIIDSTFLLLSVIP